MWMTRIALYFVEKVISFLNYKITTYNKTKH